LPDIKQRDLLVQEKLAFEALRAAIASMLSTYGRLDVAWQEVHQVQRGDQMFPMSGAAPGVSALHQTWAETSPQGKLQITGGSAFVMVVSLTEPMQSWSALAFGTSEDVDSPHFADQVKLQSEDQFKHVVFDEATLSDQLTSILTVPFDEETMARESLRAFWAKKRRMGLSMPLPVDVQLDTTDTSP
jgi:acyl-homoserine lactone acylase PvdQ